MWPPQLWCQHCSGGEKKIWMPNLEISFLNVDLYWQEEIAWSFFFFFYHWGYNWMRHFSLQRTAGSNCPPPHNMITNRLWSLVCFSFHQIPFMWYWGLAMWVGELKSGVDHVETIPPNVSRLPLSQRRKGKEGSIKLNSLGRSTLIHCINACQPCFIWWSKLEGTRADVALVLRYQFVFPTFCCL